MTRKLRKCFFFIRTINYFGYMIPPGKLKMAQEYGSD